MFNYRFQKALDHYEKLEKDASNDLIKKNNEIKEKENEIDLIEKNIIELKEKLKESLSGNIDIKLINSYQNYIQVKESNKLKESDKLKNLIKQKDDIEKDYFEKREQRKIFEKLKEKHKEKYIQENEKMEQKIIDEITNNMYNRR